MDKHRVYCAVRGPIVNLNSETGSHRHNLTGLRKNCREYEAYYSMAINMLMDCLAGSINTPGEGLCCSLESETDDGRVLFTVKRPRFSLSAAP